MDTPDLSILIITLNNRKNTFLPRIMGQLNAQTMGKRVEVVIITDDGEMNEGTKRNKAIAESKGKYFVFVDDDDRLADDYVDQILAKIPEDSDVILFDVEISIDSSKPKLVKYNKDYEHGFKDNVYYRRPNHIMCHKRSNAVEPFKNMGHGCDDAWGADRRLSIKTQSIIGKVLYFYDFCSNKKFVKVAVCSVGSKCLAVFRSSMETYAMGHEIVLSGPGGLPNTAKNFGDAYNTLLDKVFETETECIVANDDVVINPKTIKLLMEDVAILKSKGVRIGWVGARSDYVLPNQNIRAFIKDDKFVNLRYASENSMRESNVIAPIFAWVSKEAFQHGRFPPINWYTDNVSCDDMAKAGYLHFVSRAYVHHVGGGSTGEDFNKLINEAAAWLWPNRPEYAAKYGLPKL